MLLKYLKLTYAECMSSSDHHWLGHCEPKHLQACILCSVLGQTHQLFPLKDKAGNKSFYITHFQNVTTVVSGTLYKIISFTHHLLSDMLDLSICLFFSLSFCLYYCYGLSYPPLAHSSYLNTKAQTMNCTKAYIYKCVPADRRQCESSLVTTVKNMD